MTNPTPSRYRDLETLYPGLSEEEYAALEGFYVGYAKLVGRMHERTRPYPKFGHIQDEECQEQVPSR